MPCWLLLEKKVYRKHGRLGIYIVVQKVIIKNIFCPDLVSGFHFQPNQKFNVFIRSKGNMTKNKSGRHRKFRSSIKIKVLWVKITIFVDHYSFTIRFILWVCITVKIIKKISIKIQKILYYHYSE